MAEHGVVRCLVLVAFTMMDVWDLSETGFFLLLRVYSSFLRVLIVVRVAWLATLMASSSTDFSREPKSRVSDLVRLLG